MSDTQSPEEWVIGRVSNRVKRRDKRDREFIQCWRVSEPQQGKSLLETNQMYNFEPDTCQKIEIGRYYTEEEGIVLCTFIPLLKISSGSKNSDKVEYKLRHNHVKRLDKHMIESIERAIGRLTDGVHYRNVSPVKNKRI